MEHLGGIFLLLSQYRGWSHWPAAPLARNSQLGTGAGTGASPVGFVPTQAVFGGLSHVPRWHQISRCPEDRCVLCPRTCLCSCAPAEPVLWLHPDLSRSWSPAPYHHQDTGLKICHCREDTDPFAVPIQAGMCLLHFFHGINY